VVGSRATLSAPPPAPRAPFPLCWRGRQAVNSPRFWHSSSSHVSSPKDRQHEYRLNVGRATQTLQQELPHFFHLGLHTTSIFAEDIVFTSPPAVGFSAVGLGQYKAAASLLKLLTNLYFVDVEYTLLGMSQFPPGGGASRGGPPRAHHPHQQREQREHDHEREEELEDEEVDGHSPAGQQLHIRWLFEATPRHLVLATTLFPLGSPGPGGGDARAHGALRRSIYEGMFIYDFDRHGKICRHTLVSIHPTPPICKWVGGVSPATLSG
jgi:hypothetical protein